MKCACARLSSLASPVLPNFFNVVSQTAGFPTEKLQKTKCVFWFSLQILSETFLIRIRTERGMIKMYIGLHIKYPLLLSDFNKT